MAREKIGPMPKLEAESWFSYCKAAATFMLEVDLAEFENDLLHHDRFTSWTDEQTMWIIDQIKKELEERRVA